MKVKIEKIDPNNIPYDKEIYGCNYIGDDLVILPPIEYNQYGISTDTRICKKFNSNTFIGGMLTGSMIKKEIKAGRIEISPYDEKRINPNSYNVHLDRELKVYRNDKLDMNKVNDSYSIFIPNNGIVLEPNKLYIGRTVERTASPFYIPAISGRSSIGRLGMCIHITAGFGDIGFDGTWTLEITVVQPLTIYPNAEIAQVYFNTPYGPTDMQYHGRYQHQEAPGVSKYYEGREI